MDKEERELTVDGETFSVRIHADGSYGCIWLTGPNPGYGFATGASGGYRLDREKGPAPDPPPQEVPSDLQEVESIRTFLAMVDPATGFIEDR